MRVEKIDLRRSLCSELLERKDLLRSGLEELAEDGREDAGFEGKKNCGDWRLRQKTTRVLEIMKLIFFYLFDKIMFSFRRNFFFGWWCLCCLSNNL